MNRVLIPPKRLIDRIVVLGGCRNTNDELRLRNFSWLSLTMIPIGLIFLIQNILTSNYHIALVVTAFILSISCCFFLIITSHQTKIAYQISNIVFFLTLFSISFLEAKHQGRILWIYTYPLFSIFIFGSRAGSLWSLSLLFSVAGGLDILHGLTNVYSENFWLRLSITYFMVIWITAWLENDRRKYISALEKERGALEKEIAQRELLEERLVTLARTDSLTKLYNRGYYWDIVEREISRAQRYNYPLSLALIDIDDFKLVNDTYGHPTGDEVLKYLAELFSKSLRKADIVGRIGGEEFSITFPNTSLDDAKIIMERLCFEFSEYLFSFKEKEFKVTMSIGLCSIDNKNRNIDRLYSLSDKALYNAKSNGKNRVEWCVD